MKEQVTLVDAHVHVHPFVDPAAVLDAAARNFRQVATARGERGWRGMLLLAEMLGADAFKWLSQREIAGGWKLRGNAHELFSLRAEREGERIDIVAGRQAATREGLEVLALGTRAALEDRRDLTSTVAEAAGTSALVVLPWACGKWLGKRGRLIEQMFETETRVFIGDNGGRPWFWPAPAVFQRATRHLRPILPGTDPLPIPGEERRVGSRGFSLEGALSEEQPAADLVERLKSAGPNDIQHFGALERASRFVRNQIRLRLPRARAAAAGPT
jgi:hypothetical protein